MTQPIQCRLSAGVAFTPSALKHYEIEGHVAVIIDVLRASSTIITALAHGVYEVVPLQDEDACSQMSRKGYLTAAERDGKKLNGFDLGNSPRVFENGQFEGKSLALTTTNGTNSINACKNADHVLIGSFINLNALTELLRKLNKPVILVCSGWRGKFCLEDALFAGAVASELNEFQGDDAWNASKTLFKGTSGEYHKVITEHAEHVKRLSSEADQKDVAFCLQPSIYREVPFWNQKRQSLTVN